MVGYSTTFSGETHAFLWRDGVMTSLAAPGWTFTEGRAVNRSGQVAGIGQQGTFHALLWH